MQFSIFAFDKQQKQKRSIEKIISLILWNNSEKSMNAMQWLINAMMISYKEYVIHHLINVELAERNELDWSN